MNQKPKLIWFTGLSGSGKSTLAVQLEAALPPSRIAALSTGAFVGMVADDREQKIELKAFHCEILNDHKKLKNEEEDYEPLPLIRKVEEANVQQNYHQIKRDIEDLVHAEMSSILSNPKLKHLVVQK